MDLQNILTRRDETWLFHKSGGNIYYSKIISDTKPIDCKSVERTLWAYFWAYETALGNAAVLLGGRRGARLVNAIREALGHQSPATRRLRRQLLELRDILFLEHAYDDNWGDEAGLAILEPDDPIVLEICLLADGLEQALHDAGVVGMEDN